jgi:hypothetical protein
MECPNCKLENPPSALRCDCGYEFATGTVRASYAQATTSSLRHRGWWIAGWFLALFVFNLSVSWGQGSGTLTLVLAYALSKLTSPVELAISAIIICVILMAKVRRK